MKKKRLSAIDLHLQTIGLAIQARREELGLTQTELGEIAGLHRTYVSVIERKSCNISLRVFFEIANALKIGPIELLELASSVTTSKGKSQAANKALKNDDE